jgi:hypothetical protein
MPIARGAGTALSVQANWFPMSGLVVRALVRRMAIALVLVVLLAGCGDDLKQSETCDHADDQRSTSDAPPTTVGAEQAPAGKLSFEPVYCVDLADPFVLAVDRLVNDRLFVFGTKTSDFQIPVLIPKGLIRTEKIEDALAKPPGWASGSGGWAPSVLARDDGFVMYYTIQDAASGRQCISRAESTEPEGPYTDSTSKPLVCPTEMGGAIDPSAFVDGDGRPYLLWKNDGNCCGMPTGIWIQPLSDDGLSFTGAPLQLLHADQAWEGGIVEGPSMLLKDDKYYLFYSANNWKSDAYGIGYAVCEGPMGPCQKALDHPWLGSSAAAAGPGGQEFFTDGDETRMVFHAWINGKVDYDNGGHRSLFTTRITIEDGKPVAAD